MSGSSGITPLLIPPDILLAVYGEARAAYPAECCGWLTGPPGADRVSGLRSCKNAQAMGEHPTAAERGAETAYVIAGDDLRPVNRSFDQPEPAHIIYHSHPNERAYFSETDRTVAMSPWGGGPAYPVQQLVVGIGPDQVMEAALFAWSYESESFVEVARYEGAAL